jgi:single stranded DNA-binding protein
MINKIILVGRVGKDPELKSFKESTLQSFSIAVTESKKVNGAWEDVTMWFNIANWLHGDRKPANIEKGDLAYIEGKVTFKTTEGSQGYLGVDASLVRAVSRAKTDSGSRQATNSPQPKEKPLPSLEIEDDLPF